MHMWTMHSTELTIRTTMHDRVALYLLHTNPINIHVYWIALADINNSINSEITLISVLWLTQAAIPIKLEKYHQDVKTGARLGRQKNNP